MVRETRNTGKNRGVSKRKKSTLRKRNYLFTYNNYTQEALIELDKKLRNYKKCKFIFQEEKGESGTPHLQGCVSFGNARNLKELKTIDPKIHWEVARNIHACKNYCSKIDTRNGKVYSKGYEPPEEIYDIIADKGPLPWQEKLKEELKTTPDDKTVVWFVDKDGGMGKSKLCKHLCLTNKRCLYVAGSAKDVLFAVASFKPKAPKIVLWDIPRAEFKKTISYAAIEKIKDGIFFSGKYESRMFMMNCPHVYVFCNYPPDKSQLSDYKWEVRYLSKTEGKEDAFWVDEKDWKDDEEDGYWFCK